MVQSGTSFRSSSQLRKAIIWNTDYNFNEHINKLLCDCAANTKPRQEVRTLMKACQQKPGHQNDSWKVGTREVLHHEDLRRHPLKMANQTEERITIISDDTDLLVILSWWVSSSEVMLMKSGNGVSGNAFYFPRLSKYEDTVKQHLPFLKLD